MEIVLVATLMLIWIVCGILTYGLNNAEWKWLATHRWTAINCSNREILAFVVPAWIIGPVGLVASYFATGCGKHGFLLKSWETKGWAE